MYYWLTTKHQGASAWANRAVRYKSAHRTFHFTSGLEFIPRFAELPSLARLRKMLSLQK